MFSLIKSWIMKSKAAKVGAGALSGGSIIALIFYLNTAVVAKVEKQKIELKDYVKEYVQMAIEPIKTEITNLKDIQKETKEMVRDIHKFLLKTK